jgi:tRNA pseudouridine55 synthase
MDGIINVDKSMGWTSHDVVAVARRLLKEKKIGHLGTLDPLATGVLPLALGAATRLIEFTHYDKQYEAVCLLGRETDSADVTGQVIRETPWEGLDPSDVSKALRSLEEIHEQVPPMVSAVKVGGKRLYQLAREGKPVGRNPRPVRVWGVETLSMDLPRVSFRVSCSTGTYIRSLCAAMGEQLGVGGCLENLRRLRVGPFSIEQSIPLKELEKALERGQGAELLRPPSDLVSHLPAVTLPKESLKPLCQGLVQKMALAPSEWLRVLNLEGRLCAIAGAREDQIRPKKVFGLDGIA